MNVVSVLREGFVIRRFECPFCNYVKNFYGKEAKKFRKRVAGYTCPKCGKKVTDDDIRRKRGGGPKPPGERRKRSKKKFVEETPIILAPQPVVEQFEWRAGGPPPPGENLRYPVRDGWTPKTRQPTERTLGEAIMVSRGINPSAPLPDSNPDSNLEVNEKLEDLKNREALEGLADKIELHEKKLALMIVRLDRVEERLNTQVSKLCESLEQFDSKIQSFSTFVSHLASVQENYRRRPR